MPALSQRGQYIVLGVDQALLHILGGQLQASQSIAASLKILAEEAKLARQHYTGMLPSDTTGGAIVQSGQTFEKESSMTKFKTEMVKKTTAMRAPVPHAKSALDTQSFKLLDDGTGTFTFFGTNATPGDLVDVSAVATLSATPADPVPIPGLTITGPTGMAITCKDPPTGSGHEVINFVATWNDGSIGPIPVSADISWSGGAVTGGVIVQS